MFAYTYTYTHLPHSLCVCRGASCISLDKRQSIMKVMETSEHNEPLPKIPFIEQNLRKLHRNYPKEIIHQNCVDNYNQLATLKK